MGPIRGQTRPLPIAAEIVPEVQHINAKTNASIHNRFDVEVIDSATGEVRQRAQAKNVILNSFWQYFITGNWFNGIQLGSGVGTPSTSDTALFHFVVYKSVSPADDIYNHDEPNAVISLRRKIVLNSTDNNGVSFTELGIALDSGSTSVLTHAMLTDMNGNQISITKTSTDVINVYATVYLHYAHSDSSIIFDFSTITKMKGWLGVTYTVQPYAYLYRGSAHSDGFEAQPMSVTHSGKTVTFSTVTFLETKDNSIALQGLQGIYLDSANIWMKFKVGGAWFPYSAITGEAIGTGDGSTKDFSTTFEYATNATIYLDGIAQATGVTVDNVEITTIGTTKNIHFSTPPSSGAVITADYHSKTIAKNANTKFAFGFSIQLGEHTA